MHELMFQAGVKGRSERSKLIPCIDNRTYVEKVANLLTQRYAHDHDIKPIVDLQNNDSKKILLILLQK